MSADTRPATDAPGLLARAIDRPVTVLVGVILVVLFGAVSVAGLPIQLTPDITTPTMDITTRWPGAAPSEVETEILEAQEEVLKGLPGLVEMVAEARPDYGRMTLEFEVGSDIDEMLVRVSNRLSEVSSYPDAAREPVVSTSDSTGPPLAVITIRSPTGASVAGYRTWVEDQVLPEIERIPGVASIRHIGGNDTEVQVDFDVRALAERGLRAQDLAARIRGELRDVSAGELTLGKRRFLVRTPLAPERVPELEEMVLGTDDEGTPIMLADVADVSLGLRRATGVAMSDDRPAIILLLTREAGSNVLEVTEGIRRRVAELNEEMFTPLGLEIEIISDQVGYITEALDLVQQNLLLGACLAVLVLFLFLRSGGASAIISLAIPVCVFGTALGMNAMGRTVNVISLAGITFAIGMVLDNSIVVLEAIDTFRAKTATAAEAALAGVRSVWGAVLASTLTTVAVFVPIILWEGEVGQLLRDVAVAIAFAVGSSFIVSIFVIPSLAAKLLRSGKGAADAENTGEDEPASAASWGARLRDRVTGHARWLSASVPRASAVVALAMAASIGIAVAIRKPLEYLPTGNRNLIFGVLVPPPGYAVDEVQEMGSRMQAQIAEHLGREVDGVPAIERAFFVGDGSFVYAGAVAADPDDLPGVLAYLRSVQSAVPGTIGFTNQASLFGRAIGGGRSIDLRIVGSDLEAMTGVGGRFFGGVRELLPGAQVRPIPGLDPGAPELRVIPRRRQAAALGIASAELGALVDMLVDGAIVGELSPEGYPKVDVVLRARRAGGSLIETPAELASAPIVVEGGRTVPLRVVADIEERLGPTIIQRIERRRAITLSISPPEDVALETAIERIRSQLVEPGLRDGTVPAGVRIELSGAAGKLDEAAARFSEILLLAVIICFLLLAALFEDFLAPIAVLASLPLAAAGGMLSLVAVDAFAGPLTLDLMTALGFLILIGVVVNNAILVVDGAMRRLEEGGSLDDAVSGAVRSRLRPILMTTATSLAGLLPMVLTSGSGAEIYRGIGAIVLGGLTLSSLLTTYVVPCLFVLLTRLRWAFQGRRSPHAAS